MSFNKLPYEIICDYIVLNLNLYDYLSLTQINKYFKKLLNENKKNYFIKTYHEQINKHNYQYYLDKYNDNEKELKYCEDMYPKWLEFQKYCTNQTSDPKLEISLRDEELGDLLIDDVYIDTDTVNSEDLDIIIKFYEDAIDEKKNENNDNILKNIERSSRQTVPNCNNEFTIVVNDSQKIIQNNYLEFKQVNTNTFEYSYLINGQRCYMYVNNDNGICIKGTLETSDGNLDSIMFKRRGTFEFLINECEKRIITWFYNKYKN
jgi:hypothetical protein